MSGTLISREGHREREERGDKPGTEDHFASSSQKDHPDHSGSSRPCFSSLNYTTSLW